MCSSPSAHLGCDKSNRWPDDRVLLGTDGSEDWNAYDVLGDFAELACVSDFLFCTGGYTGCLTRDKRSRSTRGGGLQL